MDVETVVVGAVVIAFIVLGIIASRRVDRQLKAMSEAEIKEREKEKASSGGKGRKKA